MGKAFILSAPVPLPLQNGELRGRGGVHPRPVPVEAGNAPGGVSNFIPVHLYTWAVSRAGFL